MTHLLATLSLLTTLSAALAACVDAPAQPAGPSRVATIELTVPTSSLRPDATVQLTAVALDDEGRVLSRRALAWSSSAPTVATVSSTGLVTALAPGEVVIAASADDAVGAALIIVDDELPDDATAVARVAFDEDGPIPVVPGAGHTLHASAYTAGGDLVEGRPVSWTTADATVAAVDANGKVSALAEGTAWITATIDGQAASIELIVSPIVDVELTPGDAVIVVDEELPLTATPRDAQAQPLARPVTWSSDRPDVATVDTTGRVTGHAVGVTAITATSGGRRATVRLSVTPTGIHPLTSIDGQPLPAELYEVEVAWPDGQTSTKRVVIYDGTLTVSHAQGRYELHLWGYVTYAAVQPAVPLLTSFDHAGSVAWDPVAQTTRYTSDEGLAPLDGVMQADGSHVITLPLGEGYPTRTLRFVVE